MSVRHGFVDAVGNTPLLRLDGVSRETGCEILGKAEFMNPGGSVKDRAAQMDRARTPKRVARCKPGGTVVEGTAGNTGIGVAHVCHARGYRCVIVMPDNQSAEKVPAARAMGAEVRKVPTVPYSNPAQYQHSGRAPRRGAAQRGLGQPVRQHRQPPRAFRDRPARRSGSRPAVASTRSWRRGHRRHAALALREFLKVQARRYPHRAGRSARQRALRTSCATGR